MDLKSKPFLPFSSGFVQDNLQASSLGLALCYLSDLLYICTLYTVAGVWRAWKHDDLPAHAPARRTTSAYPAVLPCLFIHLVWLIAFKW